MDKSRCKNATEPAEKPLAWWILVFWCLTVIGLGLFWLWWPVIDGAWEIFSPRSVWFNWPFEGTLILGLAIVAFLFHAAVCSAAWMRRRRRAYIALLLAPVGLLIGVGAVLYPSGFDRPQKRVDSFQLGARWAVRRAGGAAKVRQDAEALLAATPEAYSQPFQWPLSFRALYARMLSVDENNSCVDITILPTSCFADTFGYIIASQYAPKPDLKNPHDHHGHRLWKIDDGIRLYEEW